MRVDWFHGTAFHTPRCGVLEVLEGVLISVGADGRIVEIVRREDPRHDALRSEAARAGRLTEFPAGQYLLPGLVDLHVHAPQWPQLGKALDVPLEVWLQKYTFPLEARFADSEFARAVYDDLVASLLANGTTTALYFATIHMEASLVLAEICRDRGQRALIGKVAMDDPDQCPEYYRDRDAATSIAETRDFIARLREMCPGEAALVQPVITPRFIPSCTDALLEGLGRLAAETNCRVQTHCSESDWECAFVRERFGRSDTEVLEDFGLLRRSTVLAHSNFVSDSDLKRIGAAGAAIAHCPLSNAYFARAVFPLRAALERRVHVGLGTDVSGGHSPSILDSCRHTLSAARMLEGGVNPELSPESRGVAGCAVTVAEAFWLATAGGGEALDLPVGRFAPGQKFDAIVIDADAPGSNLRFWPGLDDSADMFDKIVLNATRANIARTYVDGRLVAGA